MDFLHTVHRFEEIDDLLHVVGLGQAVHGELGGFDGSFFGGTEIVWVSRVERHKVFG